MKKGAMASLALRIQTQEELFEWLSTYWPERCVATTQTFDPNRCLAHRDRWKAERLFRLFASRVNRKVYGNAFRRFNKRLTVIPVLEGHGLTGKNYHYHALIEVPEYMGMGEFIDILEWAWSHLPGTGTHNTWEEGVDTGWLKYMLKGQKESGSLDILDVCNLWLN